MKLDCSRLTPEFQLPTASPVFQDSCCWVLFLTLTPASVPPSFYGLLSWGLKIDLHFIHSPFTKKYLFCQALPGTGLTRRKETRLLPRTHIELGKEACKQRIQRGRCKLWWKHPCSLGFIIQLFILRESLKIPDRRICNFNKVKIWMKVSSR